MGVKPSNFTLSVLVKLANRGKRPDKAFELCKEITQKYHFRLNIHVYNNLVHACTAHGNSQKGIATLEKLLSERVRPDMRTYALLLRGCISEGSAQDADGLLRSALGVEGGHPSLARFPASAVRPNERLPADLMMEIIHGIERLPRQQSISMKLRKDLNM